jgi:hypothetical protein
MSKWIEIVATVLLAVATVGSAWCAYQSARWSGVQSVSFSQAASTRTESVKAFNRATTEVNIDVTVFTQYAYAFADEQLELADFFAENLFDEEFKVAFDWWLAQDPLNNPDAADTPFDHPSYFDNLTRESHDLEIQASEHFQAALDANENSDNYVLNIVFFASALFFAGIESKFRRPAAQISLLTIGTIMFIIAVIRLFGLPIH